MIAYIEVDATNIDTWRHPIFEFARTLDIAQRCNATAVAAQRWDLTYPSLNMLNEFVARSALMIVAHNSGVVVGYLICTDDSEGKYGGCYCRWIGMRQLGTEQMADICAAMGDIAVNNYGWLWGRVSNESIRDLMLTYVDGCELGIDGDNQIVTYRKP